MRQLLDAIHAENIPHGAGFLAGYIDGNWPSYYDMLALSWRPKVLPITTRLDLNATVIDCEQGNANPSQAAGWALAKIARGQIPTVYCSEFDWPAVRQHIPPGKPVVYWIANSDTGPVMIPGAVAHQYGFKGAYDISVADNVWPGFDPIPEVVVQDLNIEMIRSDPNATEKDGGAGNGAVVAHLGGGVMEYVPPSTFSTWVNLGRPVTELAQGPWVDYTDWLARGDAINIAAIAKAVELALANALAN